MYVIFLKVSYTVKRHLSLTKHNTSFINSSLVQLKMFRLWFQATSELIQKQKTTESFSCYLQGALFRYLDAPQWLERLLSGILNVSMYVVISL